MLTGFIKIVRASKAKFMRLTLAANRVYVHLCDRFNPGKGYAWPSLDELCEVCDFCRTSILNAIKELEQSGLVQRILRGTKGRATRYQVTHLVGPSAQGELFADVDRESDATFSPPAPTEFEEFSPRAMHTTETNGTKTKPLPTPPGARVAQVGAGEGGGGALGGDRETEVAQAAKELRDFGAPPRQAEAMAREFELVTIQRGVADGQKRLKAGKIGKLGSAWNWLASALRRGAYAEDVAKPATISQQERDRRRAIAEAREKAAQAEIDAKLFRNRAVPA